MRVCWYFLAVVTVFAGVFNTEVTGWIFDKEAEIQTFELARLITAFGFGIMGIIAIAVVNILNEINKKK